MDKYNNEILEEDLERILVVKNMIEESCRYVHEKTEDIDRSMLFVELKAYASDLFLKQCEESLPSEEKSSKYFDIELNREEDLQYFNYIFENHEYSD